MAPTFTGQASSQFEPVPEGDYVLTISKIIETLTSKTAKNPEKPMWRISYDIAGTGRKVFDNIVFVKTSEWKISSWWRSLGNEVIPDKQIDTGDSSDLIGRELKANLSIIEFNGQKQNTIEYFIEPGPSGQAIVPKKPVDDEPDDIPFRTRIYKDVRNSRLNRRVF